MGQYPIANYTHEQAQFRELIESDSNPNILMFQGGSGSGKSHLIDHCISSVPKEQMPVAQIRLQSGGDTIPNLFNAMGIKIGRSQLPAFSERVAGLVGKRPDSDDAAWKTQLRRHLREIGRNSDLDTRQDWYLQLTDAWFTDAEGFDRPLLVAIDTYEQSSSEFDSWFRDEFLYGVANTSNLRVLVGGQTLPEPQTEWNAAMSVYQLKGVTEAEEWMVWGERNGIQIPSLEFMAGICVGLEGKPSKIIQVLQSFPKTVGPVNASAPSIKEKRQAYRRAIAAAFNVSELKTICFDLDIEYENFESKIDLFVIDLLRFVMARGRLAELEAACKEVNPSFSV